MAGNAIPCAAIWGIAAATIAVAVSIGAMAAATAYHGRYRIITIAPDPGDPHSVQHQTMMVDSLTGRTWLLEAQVIPDNPAATEETWEPLGYTQATTPRPAQEQRNPY